MERLRAECYAKLEDSLREQTVFPRELEAYVWGYYQKTSPSLQEFYSRYTPEWEVFYESEPLSPSAMLDFMKRMKPAFAKRYPLFELDIDYYIGRMKMLPQAGKERKELQESFLDKWHRLLNAKEYDYQYHHIDELCRGFILLDKRFGLKTEASQPGSRIKWLMLNHPELYRRIFPYERQMEKNASIRELVRVLGKRSAGERMSFDSLSGISKESLVRHAVQSDIAGITVGDNLNSLLPAEYCCLSDEKLHPVFLRKYVEKRLQVFDSRSVAVDSSSRSERHPVSGQGPFIVCVDTSGSMGGRREMLAKSAVLAIARLVEKTHRRCYVINFAEEVQTLLVRDFRTDLPMLAEFLAHSFDGGTDIRPAVGEALVMLRNQRWKRSDVVLISDFELPPADDALLESVRKAKLSGTSFYALLFGTHPEPDYLNFCDKYWEVR